VEKNKNAAIPKNIPFEKGGRRVFSLYGGWIYLYSFSGMQ